MIFKYQNVLQTSCKTSLQGGQNSELLISFPFTCKWKAECGVNPLIWEGALPVDAVTSREGCSNFRPRFPFTYSVTTFIKKLFPPPTFVPKFL